MGGGEAGGGSEMVQQINALAIKPKNLKSITETKMVEGDT